MTGTGLFATFLTVALLVPAILLLIVRLATSVLPPTTSWLSAFGQRHVFTLSLLEAACWLALFTRQIVTGAEWPEGPFMRGAQLLFAATAIIRAVRHRRGSRTLEAPAQAN